MVFKALKSFVSSIGTFNENEEYDVKLDKSTSKMWIEHGLIEKVTAAEAAQVEEVKPVETDENK